MTIEEVFKKNDYCPLTELIKLSRQSVVGDEKVKIHLELASYVHQKLSKVNVDAKNE